MDITVRFWKDTSNQALTLYITSTFLRHATSFDIRNDF